MIGVVCGEEYVAFEFRPIFASTAMRWAKVVIKVSPPVKWWGEWGVAFTKRFTMCLFTGHEMRFVSLKWWRK